jgi:carbonic anhydrase
MPMPTRKVIEGHRRFRERFESENEVFARLAEEGQNPKVLWIGCSDSRVIPELITGADPGELFNVRNIANIVPPASDEACSTGAAIEYAVLHLDVNHVVVCGHTGCGGIKALEAPPSPEAEPHIAAWLGLAAAARRQVLARGTAPEDVYLETIKANVLLQCDNLRSYSCVAAAEQAGKLSVHAWLYDLRSGVIEEHQPACGSWESIAHSR